MKIFTAELSEILLAERRDEEQIDRLTTEISEIVKDLFGSQFWISCWNYYPIIATAVYYTVTTLSAVQTVGEEYVALLPLSSAEHRKVPSFRRRLIFIFCFALAPLLTGKVLKLTERYLENLLISDATHFDRKQRDLLKTVLNIIVWIRSTGIPSLYRLHLALFYLFGTYYNISKRLIGLQYVSFRPQSNSQVLPLFRFFGALTVTQFAVNAFVWIRNELKRSESKKPFQRISESSETEIFEEKDEDSLFVSDTFRCPICSQYNKPPACTPCGHLFCWNCISKHIQFTVTDSALTFCPVCRQAFHQSRVVPLLNL